MAGTRRSDFNSARWWTVRRAQSKKPATYTCPFCRDFLPAFSIHMMVLPEGDRGRRRHAHIDCVQKAREAGRLPSEDEWRRDQPRPPRRGLLDRLWGRED